MRPVVNTHTRVRIERRCAVLLELGVPTARRTSVLCTYARTCALTHTRTNSSKQPRLHHTRKRYLAYQAVHCPSEVPPEYMRGYAFSDPARNIFAGMLAALDEGIGNLTATLKAAGRWESTLFVLTSDNGAPTPGCGGAQVGGCFDDEQNSTDGVDVVGRGRECERA